MAGPLEGVRIIELGSIGPGPFAGMMLADNGAEVIRVERPGSPTHPDDPNARSRQIIVLDFKKPEDILKLRELVKDADGLIEGFRPGVAEKIGVGPDVLLADNPRLAYGRMTGWGQDGPYAPYAGHDLNYIAMTGALHAIGDPSLPPPPPLNLIGDYGGGGMMLAFGMVSAILHARTTGVGQVVDCAMVDGANAMMGLFHFMAKIGLWNDARGTNILAGGAPFYGTYETSDGKYVSIGSMEPQFFALLLEKLDLTGHPLFANQQDMKRWPEMKQHLAGIFKTRTRAQWCELMEHSDICFAPVLTLTEAKAHPHNVAREAFIDVGGTIQPAPAPRYSATPLAKPWPAVRR